MRQITIARDPHYHHGFTDLARAANGDLVVLYKRADAHTSFDFTDLVAQVSHDQGETWDPPVVLMATHDAIDEGLIRDPHIVRLQDGSLLASAAIIGPRRKWPRGVGYFERYMQNAKNFLFRSSDHGQTWQAEETRTIPMVCELVQLRSGVILMGATEFHYRHTPNQVGQAQVVYRSLDNGHTWDGPYTVGDHPEHALGEGSIVELDNGTLVCYMRDEPFRPDLPMRTSGAKAFSQDEGLTWDGPYGSGRWLTNGGVAAGLLSNGHVMVISRLGMGKTDPYFGYFQDEPRRLPEFVGYYQHNSPLLHAYVESQADALIPHPPSTQYADPLPASASWLTLDNDLNEHPDYGYPGWVNLPSGDVYACDFIADDAPAAQCQIRGYRLTLDELLHPDRDATFQASDYQPGPLAGQDDWVHQSGPHSSTVLVKPDEGIVPGTISAATMADWVARGVVLPSQDPSQAGAEILRRDIGPFNLHDEHVTVEFEHRGQSQFCGLQVMDDCRAPIVELRSTTASPKLQAYLPGEWRIAAAGPAVGNDWWRSRVEVTAQGVRISSLKAGEAGSGETWYQASLPGLQVVGALGLKLGGEGNFTLRSIEVSGGPAQPAA